MVCVEGEGVRPGSSEGHAPTIAARRASAACGLGRMRAWFGSLRPPFSCAVCVRLCHVMRGESLICRGGVRGMQVWASIGVPTRDGCGRSAGPISTIVCWRRRAAPGGMPGSIEIRHEAESRSIQSIAESAESETWRRSSPREKVKEL